MRNPVYKLLMFFLWCENKFKAKRVKLAANKACALRDKAFACTDQIPATAFRYSEEQERLHEEHKKAVYDLAQKANAAKASLKEKAEDLHLDADKFAALTV